MAYMYHSAPDELQTDTIVSKWFADDGTVMEYAMSRLQWLVDTLIALVILLGLVIKVPKTKVMLTTAKDQSAAQVTAAQADIALVPL